MRKSVVFTMFLAIALMLDLSLVHAAGVSCTTGNGEDKNTAMNGATCDAKSDGTGTATAFAQGKDAGSDASVKTGGGSNATSSAKGGGAFTDAETQASNCPSSATATGGGEAEAFCDKADGISTAIGRQKGSDGEADSESSCTTFAEAVGKGSVASAECFNPGGNASACASGGATAEALDNGPPDCDISHGGYAQVVSDGGNCCKGPGCQLSKKSGLPHKSCPPLIQTRD